MRFFKAFLCVLVFNFIVTPSAFAESISQAAKRISTARKEKEDLEKNKVEIGQTIEEIGSLSIDDFLELEALPEGLDAVSGQKLYDKEKNYNFMSTKQMLTSIEVMRRRGVDLPKDLEKQIQKNPENASKLLSDALDTIQPAEVETEADIAKQRQQVIKEAENNLGVGFKSVLDKQKEMMGLKEKTVKKRGHL